MSHVYIPSTPLLKSQLALVVNICEGRGLTEVGMKSNKHICGWPSWSHLFEDLFGQLPLLPIFAGAEHA